MNKKISGQPHRLGQQVDMEKVFRQGSQIKAFYFSRVAFSVTTCDPQIATYTFFHLSPISLCVDVGTSGCTSHHGNLFKICQFLKFFFGMRMFC